MTREELRKEAQAFAKKWCEQHNMTSRHVRIGFAVDFALAAATLRDKEIEALLAKVAELEADASAVAIQEKRMYLSLPETK